MSVLSEVDAGSMVAAASAPAVRELPLEFRATGSEYFRIWVVNLLLTILTLGVFSAWAKVRRLRYFYGSTSLDGSSFDYHGKPIAILKGRLIVVGIYASFYVTAQFWPLINLVFLPLVIFGVPWVIVRSRLFQMRMTSWRGLRFNFHGSYGGALGAFIGWALLGVLTLLILWPLALWKQVSYLVTNTSFGTQRFGFATPVGRFYRFCLIALGIALGTGLCAAVAFGAIGGFFGTGFGPAVDPDAQGRAAAASAVIGVSTFGLAALVAGAWYRAQFVNASIGGTTAGPHQLAARLRTGPLLGIMVTNLLAMVMTLGLFYPWAKVRLLRYQLDNTRVLVAGDLSQILADARTGANAVGEEAGDFFDIDFGI